MAINLSNDNVTRSLGQMTSFVALNMLFLYFLHFFWEPGVCFFFDNILQAQESFQNFVTLQAIAHFT